MNRRSKDLLHTAFSKESQRSNAPLQSCLSCRVQPGRYCGESVTSSLSILCSLVCSGGSLADDALATSKAQALSFSQLTIRKARHHLGRLDIILDTKSPRGASRQGKHHLGCSHFAHSHSGVSLLSNEQAGATSVGVLSI